MQTFSLDSKIAELLAEAYDHEVYAAATYNQFAAVQSAKGYAKLAAKHVEEAAEEMGHARKLAEWLTLCGQTLDLAVVKNAEASMKVTDQLRAVINIEEKAINVYEDIMEQADGVSDYKSYHVAAEILNASREHYIWAMQQLSLIEELGLPNWLTMWS